MLTTELVKREIELLNKRFTLALESAQDTITELQAGRDKDHGTHKLASTTQELSVLAGKIAAMEMVLRGLEESK